MPGRALMIGALGGDRQGEHARALGRAVAMHGCILLTGGGDREDSDVKNAAVMGCLEARRDGYEGRAIGILPSNQVYGR